MHFVDCPIAPCIACGNQIESGQRISVRPIKLLGAAVVPTLIMTELLSD